MMKKRDYELRCMEPTNEGHIPTRSTEYHTSWISVQLAYLKKKKQYRHIQLTVRTIMKE